MPTTTALPSALPANMSAGARMHCAQPARDMPSFAQALNQARADDTAPADTHPKPDEAARPQAQRKTKASTAEADKKTDTQSPLTVAATPCEDEATASPQTPGARHTSRTSSNEKQPADASPLPAWLPPPARTDMHPTSKTAATAVTTDKLSSSPERSRSMESDMREADKIAPLAKPQALFDSPTPAFVEANIEAKPLDAAPVVAPPAMALSPMERMHAGSLTETAAPAAPFQAELAAAIGNPAFAPELGARVSVLARDGVQQAQLHLNPAETGPISVRIDVVESTVQVQFSAEHAATRAAIEAGLPQLAAALRDSGLTLTGGGVFEQPRGQRDSHHRSTWQASHRQPDNRDAATVTPRTTARRGVIDLYA